MERTDYALCFMCEAELMTARKFNPPLMAVPSQELLPLTGIEKTMTKPLRSVRLCAEMRPW